MTPIDLRVEGMKKLQEREDQSGKSFFRDKPREVQQIDSIVLHQMGFSRGTDPMRYLGVPAHYIVMADGTIAQLHNWETYLFTSNALNSRSIGVEIAATSQTRTDDGGAVTSLGAIVRPTNKSRRSAD